MITQQIKLNLIPGQVFPRVNASQYDSGTRTLQMALYNGDQVFNIASGMTAVVQGTKPDKTGFQYAATITEGSNIATLDITQQMTAVKGDVTCELVISNGNNRIATVNFILYVEAAALADDTVISETELPLIEEAVEAAQRIGPIAQQVAEDAQTASDAATRAEDAAEAAETWSSNAPYIGANDHWYVYDSATEQFVDTGVSAEGQTGPQGPQGPQGPTGATGPQGPTGATGNGITSITKTSTSGLVDTYTILFTDGTQTTFTVTNGQDGQGSGDMTKAVYDSTNAVADAGGIVAYVQAHSGAGTLAGLDDVALSSLAAGQSLVYNATTQKWENGQISYANISGKPSLGSAAAKDSTSTLSSGSTDLIESGAVYSAIQTLTNDLDTVDRKVDENTEDIAANLASINILKSNGNWRTGLRFKNLGTSFTSEQQTALANGDFSEFWNGDYWVIGGHNWRIVDNSGIARRRGDTNFDSNSLVIMPDDNLVTAEAYLIDNDNASGHGYSNCAYRTRTDGKGRAQCKSIISSAFGSSHIASHRELMSSARGTGGATSWAWTDADVELPSEANIYGHPAWGAGVVTTGTYATGYNVGTEWGQFMLFRLAPYMAINRSQNYWLRDIVSASAFAFVGNGGNADRDTPSNPYIGLRPHFILV